MVRVAAVCRSLARARSSAPSSRMRPSSEPVLTSTYAIALLVRRLAEDLGQTQRLGQLQRELEPRRSHLGLVAEHEEPSELRRGVREVLVRLFVRERGERRLESRNRLGEVSVAVVDLGHGGRDPRRPSRQTRRLEGGQRPAEVHPRPPPAAARATRSTRLLFQRRLGKWVVGELGRLGEVPFGLLVRSERGRTHSGTGKPLAGRRTNLRRHPRRRGQPCRHRGSARQRPRRPPALRVSARGTRRRPGVAPSGRPWRTSHRPPCGAGPAESRTGRARASAGRPGHRRPPCGERGQQRLEVRLGKLCQRGDRLLRERLAEDGGVLDDAALGLWQSVEPGGDQCVERLRDLERLDRSRRPIDVAAPARAAPGRAACARFRPRTAECPRRWPRICARSSSGRPGTRPVEQLLHRVLGKRLQVDRTEVSVAGPPGRAAARAARAAPA